MLPAAIFFKDLCLVVPGRLFCLGKVTGFSLKPAGGSFIKRDANIRQQIWGATKKEKTIEKALKKKNINIEISMQTEGCVRHIFQVIRKPPFGKQEVYCNCKKEIGKIKRRREKNEERIPESKRKPEHYKRNHQRKNAPQIRKRANKKREKRRERESWRTYFWKQKKTWTLQREPLKKGCCIANEDSPRKKTKIRVIIPLQRTKGLLQGVFSFQMKNTIF